MSEPRYTDEDLKRVAGIKDEQAQDAFQTFFESMEALLDRRLRPIETNVAILKTDMATVKVALSETNRDVRIVKKQTEKLTEFADEVTDHGVRLDLLEHSRRE